MQGNEAKIDELLSSWQVARASGRDLSAADLCRDQPELLVELERRIAQLRAMQGLAATGDVLDTVPSNQVPPLPFMPAVPGYEILEELGCGGMGQVWKARHIKLGKVVALKLIRDGRQSAEATGRFLREMKAIGQLDHANVVEAYDAGECDGTVYLAMKLIDG
jgi:serine/threonine-protein kinase